MRKIFLAVVVCVASLWISLPAESKEVELLGAGATFPYPLYSKMFDVYHKQKGVKINYQAIGSGGGIRQLSNKTVDFGASDAFMGDEALAKSDKEILHVPICLGAVVVAFNVPGISEMKFTPEIIAGIYLGKIKEWNDPAIAEANPGVKLPGMKIIAVRRSDGSGTTFIFTDYLAKISKEWSEKVGRGKAVNWPAALGAKGNAGVAGMVRQLPGGIGYIELAYAVQNRMAIGSIKNKSGNFIKPSLESTSLAANIEMPADARVSVTDTASEQGYPISGFTWILVYKEQDYKGRDKEKIDAMVDLLSWMTFQGQAFVKPLHYAPLPDKAVQVSKKIIESITFKGEKVWQK